MNKFIKIFGLVLMIVIFAQAFVYLSINKDDFIESSPENKEISINEIKKGPRPKSQLSSYKSCNFTTDEKPTHQPVVFQEINWMGSKESSNDEFIVIKNISSGAVNLSAWQIINENGRLAFMIPQGTISRSDQEATFRRGIDYTGALKNGNEGLRIFDNNCRLIDEVFAKSNWPAGDNKNKITMKRAENLSWYDTSVIANNNEAIFKDRHGANTPRDDIGIKISEVQPGSENGANDEFVKLHNPNDKEINLSGWSLKKRTASGKEYNLLSPSKFETTISPDSYLVISHKDFTGNADIYYSNNSNPLANSNNVVVLYNSGGIIADEFSY